MDTEVILRLTKQLNELQNEDGGWGWAAGMNSNVEATAYALMALGEKQALPSHRSPGVRGRSWLLSMQRNSGAWPYTGVTAEDSWVTALAVLALSSWSQYSRQTRMGAAWLLQQKGERLGWLPSLMYRMSDKTKVGRMNPDLQGWAWAPQTASWVEPTAYALIALRKLRPHLDTVLVDQRIRQGEQLLYDRMCIGGGWNYGNATVLNERLAPYPDVTAISLIALQKYRYKRENRQSLQVLNELVKQQRSGLILSWTIICRSLYGERNTLFNQQLLDQYSTTGFMGQCKTLALSLIALDGQEVHFEV